MFAKIKESIEPDLKIRTAEIILLVLMLAVSLASFLYGTSRINAVPADPVDRFKERR